MTSNEEKDLPFSYKIITPPILSRIKRFTKIPHRKSIKSDEVVELLEKRSHICEFEYSHVRREDSDIFLGYEVKPVENVDAI